MKKTVIRYEWSGFASCSSINRWLMDHGMSENQIIISRLLDMDESPVYDIALLETNGSPNFGNWNRKLIVGVDPVGLWNSFTAAINRMEQFEDELHYIYHDEGNGWNRYLGNAITNCDPDDDRSFMFIEFDDPNVALEFKLIVDHLT